MTPEPRTRDKVWLAVLDALRSQSDLTTAQLAEETGVSRQTVNEILRVAEQHGELTRDSPQGKTWKPASVLVNLEQLDD